MRANRSFVSRYSREHDEIAASLGTAFLRVTDIEFPRGVDNGRLAHARLSLGDLCMDRYECSGIRFRAVQSDKFHVGLPTQGGVRVRTGKGEVSTQAFAVGNTLPSNLEFVLDVEPASINYTVEFSLPGLMRRAESLVGQPLNADDFDTAVALQSGPGAALVRTVLSAFGELQAMEDLQLGALGASAYGELLANLVLAAVHRGVRAKLEGTPAKLAPALAEKARRRLAERAHEAVTIGDVAMEMGVSVRALQVSFQRQIGCSPLQYLLKCRLELARLQLLSPAAADTVSRIAIDCGFLNLGRFALRYRGVYGELPSDTLSRMRRMLGFNI